MFRPVTFTIGRRDALRLADLVVEHGAGDRELLAALRGMRAQVTHQGETGPYTITMPHDAWVRLREFVAVRSRWPSRSDVDCINNSIRNGHPGADLGLAVASSLLLPVYAVPLFLLARDVAGLVTGCVVAAVTALVWFVSVRSAVGEYRRRRRFGVPRRWQ